MILTLASASLLRHRTRTALAILGVGISAAMLLDMVMLSSGMRESFKGLLLEQGFQFRLAPKGTLPFDTEATLRDGDSIVALLRTRPEVQVVSPVLGGQLHVQAPRGTVATSALGIIPAYQGDYELVAGHHPNATDEMVANDALLAATGLRVGDTVHAGAGYDSQLRALSGERTLRIVGRARFIYMAAEQKGAALPIETLRIMQGREALKPVSIAMIRIAPEQDVAEESAVLQKLLPHVTVISTAEALQQVDERMSYFRQLAVILGAVSLVVGFLLVTTLVTVSVNERIGEIAVMRAIGVHRWRVIAQIVAEAAAMMLAATPLGLGLGLVTARYLNSILANFPGLPERIDFFLFQPRAAWGALGMLAVSGVLAAVYPFLALCIAPNRDHTAPGGGRVSALVAVRDLVREYPMGEERVAALKGVTFDVEDGEYAAIVGPSGCGKSTLLNLLGVIDRPTSGTVSIEGERVDQLSDARATEFRLRRIGFVFQRFYLMQALTARENIELPLAEAGVKGAARRDRARALLDYVGLARRESHRPSQLSGGEQQRVAIARALANSPKLLLADEPTGELDARTGAEMIALFERLNADGTTILVVTHDEDLAAAARRVIHMRDGSIVGDERAR